MGLRGISTLCPRLLLAYSEKAINFNSNFVFLKSLDKYSLGLYETLSKALFV